MILCSGCFDGLHAGHVAYLAAAKAMCAPGEELVVAIAPDSYIREQKGREPFWPIDQRLFTVSALRMVDRAVEQWSSLAWAVDALKPRVLVKGTEWRGKLPKDLIDNGIPVVFVPTEGARHTSEARG